MWHAEAGKQSSRFATVVIDGGPQLLRWFTEPRQHNPYGHTGGDYRSPASPPLSSAGSPEQGGPPPLPSA